MNNNWLYFHIFDNDKSITMCCVKEKTITQTDLSEFDNFLAYYGQNYKMHKSVWEENVTHTCLDMICVRKHIIDANIKKCYNGE